MDDTYEIVERLNKLADAAMYAEGSPFYPGDSPFGAQIREAAALIVELAEALETIAEGWIEPETMEPSPPVASDLQKIARSALSRLKGKTHVG
jgi:hypothetical protein